jgi:hypothetical protein
MMRDRYVFGVSVYECVWGERGEEEGQLMRRKGDDVDGE